jgi:hypothetical protein
VAAIIVGPWVEEFWIAYNFDRLCKKDAGLFINKVVEADGFYDSTRRSAYELTRTGPYKFVEHATVDLKGTEHVELATAIERQRALAWYEKQNPGRERQKDRSVFYPLNEKETIVVFPNGIDAWKVTKLDKPTARYQYRRVDDHKPIVHQIKRFESVVADNQTEEILGRYTNYRRGPYSFFISLDAPTIECSELKGKDIFVYPYVLKPTR